VTIRKKIIRVFVLEDIKDSIEKGQQEFLWAKNNMSIITKIIKKYKNKKILEMFDLGM
jgi:S-adenosylhomocysteine hydrolase